MTARLSSLSKQHIYIQVMRLVITEVRSESFKLVTERRHDILVLCAVTHIFAYWTSPVYVTHVIFVIIECGIVRFLCTMHVFNVRASSSSPGYLCAKFRYCCSCTLYSWASPWRHIAYSINKSITHPPTHSLTLAAYLMRRELKLLLRNSLF